MNQQFVKQVHNRLKTILNHVPKSLLDETVFHSLKEEFENTLPRSVSRIKQADLLARRSSTPTFTINYLEGKLDFKFSDDMVQMRHYPSPNDYTDYKGYEACFELLSKLTEQPLHDNHHGTQSN